MKDLYNCTECICTEGVTDNKPTTSVFQLLFEVVDEQVPLDTRARLTAYHSLLAYDTMLSLQYPPMVILADKDRGLFTTEITKAASSRWDVIMHYPAS
ncbi:unnamed protein product [Gongylonema pulchrum]|uniref:Piwi domain-containing protein n=1 Tax=Gongylonema pulchrum TaxID=637853 RepID=A0A183EST8_9BILA|nr:unnamed protein product [Gongylonema pulchrum]